MMKVSAFVAMAGVASGQVLSETAYQGMFRSWVQQHGKTYENVEVSQKFNAFKANDQKITKHNMGNHTWYMEHNKFSDLTSDEFLSQYTGFDSSLHGEDDSVITGPGDINADIDWVAKGAVTAVKDQGQCGSCWAFSTTGAIEGAVQIASGKLTSLSEQELVDSAGAQGNQGCNGGLMDNAFKYVQNKGGLCTEVDYAYTAKDGTFQSSCTHTSKISGFTDVAKSDESALLAALGKGPVSIAVDAGAFQSYGGGVMSSCSGRALNHGVLLVGYDGTNWKVKNSWGASWGESGYIRMPYGADCCGMADAASQPQVDIVEFTEYGCSEHPYAGCYGDCHEEGYECGGGCTCEPVEADIVDYTEYGCSEHPYAGCYGLCSAGYECGGDGHCYCQPIEKFSY